ncbi:MAG: hypothetical protein HY040_20760 [Planctomycetes bacterium]|nr:hypothetical protein [Planctomycetota bacterium]
MKATIVWAGALIGVAAAAVPSFADYPPYFSPVVYQRQGNACPNYGQGSFAPQNQGGLFYGHLHPVQPGFPPSSGIYHGMFNGNGGIPGANGTPGSFPSHTYMRGPRDFFMWREVMEDAQRRDQRPNLVP